MSWNVSATRAESSGKANFNVIDVTLNQLAMIAQPPPVQAPVPGRPSEADALIMEPRAASAGDAIPSKVLYASGREHGIVDRTLHRAAKRAGLVPVVPPGQH